MEDDSLMKSTLLTMSIVALGLSLTAPSLVRADYFGKIEPRLIQVTDGKKGGLQKTRNKPEIYSDLLFGSLVSSLPGFYSEIGRVVQGV